VLCDRAQVLRSVRLRLTMKPTAALHTLQTRESLHASQSRVPQLDGLRGIAVLSVILYHYVPVVSVSQGGFWSSLLGWVRLGRYGVDLFFVLSGFLIGGILLDSKESPRYFRTFYLRRFHRIFPLYYFWLAIYAALGLTVFPNLPDSIKATWSGWRPLLVYALFVQNLVSKQIVGISAAWLGPLWSLAVEEQFYLLMPLAVRFLHKRRLAQLLVATVLLSPALRVVVSKWYSHADQFVATPLRADGLAMGVLLALALREQTCRRLITRNPKWLYVIIAMFVVGILCLAPRAFAPGGRSAVWVFSVLDPLFAAIILLALVRPGGWWAYFCRQTALRNLGVVSYCIYVIHLAVISICQGLLHVLYKTGSFAVEFSSVLLAFIITWLLAKISWRYLESPMVRRGHTYTY